MTTHGNTIGTIHGTALNRKENKTVDIHAENMIRRDNLKKYVENISEDDAQAIANVLVETHPEVLMKALYRKWNAMSDYISDAENLLKGLRNEKA